MSIAFPTCTPRNISSVLKSIFSLLPRSRVRGTELDCLRPFALSSTQQLLTLGKAIQELGGRRGGSDGSDGAGKGRNEVLVTYYKSHSQQTLP